MSAVTGTILSISSKYHSILNFFEEKFIETVVSIWEGSEVASGMEESDLLEVFVNSISDLSDEDVKAVIFDLASIDPKQLEDESEVWSPGMQNLIKLAAESAQELD